MSLSPSNLFQGKIMPERSVLAPFVAPGKTITLSKDYVLDSSDPDVPSFLITEQEDTPRL